MSVPVPDRSAARRMAELERRLVALESEVRRASGVKSITPLNARLWRATLNEVFSYGLAGADLLTISGTDTGKDITLYDPLNVFEDLENGDGVYCLEQIDADGTTVFVPIQAPCPPEE